MESKVHSANQKSGHHFIYLDVYNIQRRMNKQSGFNAEQINKDKNPESKNHLKIKPKIREGRKPVVFHESSPNFPAGKRIVQF